MHSTDEFENTEIAGTVAELRLAYKNEKSAVLGGKHKVGMQRPADRTNLVKTAKACLALNANPEDYMRIAFMVTEASTGPMLSMLASKKVIKAYKEYAEKQLNIDVKGKRVEVNGQQKWVHLEIEKVKNVARSRHGTSTITDTVIRDTLLNPVLVTEPFAVSIVGSGYTLIRQHVHPKAYKQIMEDKSLKSAISFLGYYEELKEILKYGRPE